MLIDENESLPVSSKQPCRDRAQVTQSFPIRQSTGYVLEMGRGLKLNTDKDSQVTMNCQLYPNIHFILKLVFENQAINSGTVALQQTMVDVRNDLTQVFDCQRLAFLRAVWDWIF